MFSSAVVAIYQKD